MADVLAMLDQIAVQLRSVQRHDNGGTLKASAGLLDNVVPPCAVATLGAATFDDQLPGGLGMDIIGLKVIVYAGRSDIKNAEAALHAYMRTTGPTSVKAALEANRKLRTDPDDPATGLCDRLRVLGTNDPGVAVVADVEYAAVEFNLAATCAPD